MNYRRYATLKIAAHVAAHEGGLAAVWRAKRAEHHGSALPADLPTAALSCAGYEALEDLEGATSEELLRAGLPFADAEIVLAFLNPAPPT